MLFVFFITSVFILASTIGYGLLIKKIIGFRKLDYNYGLIGLLGLFFLSIISSYTHLILPHGYFHNIVIILIGLISLILFKKKIKESPKYLFIVFSLLFLCILLSKNNEDFGYYHLPNSLQFAQQKLQFGLGNINHGFKHISSLFMLMSLHYLPIFEYKLFNLTNLLFLTFFSTLVLTETHLIKNHKISNISKTILALFFVLLLTKFSRLAEYGSDISGQIIIATYTYYLIELIFNDKLNFEKKNDYLKLAIFFIIFATTLKFILVIYSLFLLMFITFSKEKKKIIFSLLKFNFLLIIFLSFSIFVFLNFSSTGCLIYPVEKLCFSEKFDWTLSNEIIKYMNFHYEIWAKGGRGANIFVLNESEYITMFKWLPNWFNLYFYGKFSDFILVSFVIVMVFIFFFQKEIFKTSRTNQKKNLKNYIFYFFSLIIFFLWFLNFPTLRYGGYIIVFLLIIFPFSIFFNEKINLNKKINSKKLLIIFLISYSIFAFKNFSRIKNEFILTESDHHNFKNFPFFWIKNSPYKEIKINDHKLYLTEDSCWGIPSTCVRNIENLEIIKKNNYIFYLNK